MKQFSIFISGFCTEIALWRNIISQNHLNTSALFWNLKFFPIIVDIFPLSTSTHRSTLISYCNYFQSFSAFTPQRVFQRSLRSHWTSSFVRYFRLVSVPDVYSNHVIQPCIGLCFWWDWDSKTSSRWAHSQTQNDESQRDSSCPGTELLYSWPACVTPGELILMQPLRPLPKWQSI